MSVNRFQYPDDHKRIMINFSFINSLDQFISMIHARASYF